MVDAGFFLRSASSSCGLCAITELLLHFDFNSTVVRIVSGLILLFAGLLFACLFVWISFHSSFSVASVVPGGRLFAECQPTRCSLQQQPSTVHFSKEYCNSVLTNCKCIIVQCTIGCITVHLMHCDRVNHIMTQSVNPLSASRSCCDPYASTPILTHLTRTKNVS